MSKGPKQIIDPPGAAVETFRRRSGRLPNRLGDQLPLEDRLELAAQACRAAHLLSCEATCREAIAALMPNKLGIKADSAQQNGHNDKSETKPKPDDKLDRHLLAEHHAIQAQDLDSPFNACCYKETCLWLRNLVLAAPSLEHRLSKPEDGASRTPEDTTSHIDKKQRMTLADELEALWAQATPGPWAWDQRGEKVNEWALGTAFDENEQPLAGRFDDENAIYDEYVCSHEAATCNYKDPALICSLRNNLPTIIAALRAFDSSANTALDGEAWKLIEMFAAPVGLDMASCQESWGTEGEAKYLARMLLFKRHRYVGGER